VVEIHINQNNRNPERLTRSDQTVCVFSGPGNMAVESVYDRDIEDMMETYHRDGDTYTGGAIRSKCRCGCSHS